MSYTKRKPHLFKAAVASLLLLSLSFLYGCSFPTSDVSQPPIVAEEPQKSPSGEFLGTEETNPPVETETPPGEIHTPTLSKHLIVEFIDVGQGDSILVISPDGKTMLIDAGDQGKFNVIDGRLKKYGVEKIDVLIATHPHADHIGSMKEVVETYPIGELYMPEAISTSKVFEKLLLSVEKKGLGINIVGTGDSIDFSPYLQSRIVSPTKGATSTNLNNASIVLHLLYGETSFLFTGDIEYSAEKAIDNMLTADVLKVAHHGSDSSTASSFLNSVSPSIAVISVGKENKYGHPNSAILERLKTVGATVLRTDQVGHVTIESDGINIKVTSDISAATNSTTNPAVSAKPISPTKPATPTKEEPVVTSPPSNPNSSIAHEVGETVCATKAGSKYHRDGCTYLSKSKIAITKEAAIKNGLEPCKVCRP